MKKAQVKCRHCKGRGTIGLPRVLESVLAQLLKGPADAPTIFERMRAEHDWQTQSVGATSNALARLIELKFVIRRKVRGHRAFIYTLTESV